MKRISTYLLFLITFTINGFALSCDSLSEFKQYGGKWYALSSSKITWDVAKAIAENNGGYLAIPKNASENQFLKNAFNGGWLGVYDPTFSSNYCSEYEPNCIANINNYKTVLGEVLTYHNFATGEPSNTIYDTDIIDGNQLVSPLGEHWVAMGQNGQWGDFGNHARENNNPIRMRAIFEFTSKPECAPESGVNETDYTTKKCQTQVYDTTSGVLGHGQLFDCQQDQYGTDYCPSALSACAQEWDYDDGFSVAGIGQVVDYTGMTNWEPGPTFKTPTGIEYFKAAEEVLHNEAVGLCSSLGARLPTYLETSNYDSNGVPPYKASSSSWTSDVDIQSSRTYYRVWNSTSSSWVMTKYPISDYESRNTNEKRDVVCVTGNQPQQIKKAQNGLYYFNLNTSLTLHQASNACNSYGGGFRLPGLNETLAVSSIGVPSFDNQFTWTSNYQLRTYGGCGPVPHTHWYLSYKDNTTQWNQVTIQCNGYHNTNHRAATICVTQNKPEALTKCPQGYIETTGSETLKGQCKKIIEYTYYNYLCSPDKNSQGFGWEIVKDSGGNCNPNNLDELIDTDGDDIGDSCNSSISPTNNCKREKFMCQANKDRPCSFVDNSWQCSPFPCFGDENYEDLDTKVGATDSIDKGFSDDGNCYGQIRLFNGKDMRCRSMDWSLLGKNCCSRWKIGGIAGLLGASCKEDEIALAKYRQEQKDKSHEVGEYCSKKLKLGFTKICIQKKRTYCVFNSKLARIIHQGGRPQLGIGWGSPQSPNCKGFTPEQFQKLDFSKIDMGEFYSDVQQSISKKIDAKIGTTIQQKVEGFGSNLGGGS